MLNCSTYCLCPSRIATNGSTSLFNENFLSINCFFCDFDFYRFAISIKTNRRIKSIDTGYID